VAVRERPVVSSVRGLGRRRLADREQLLFAAKEELVFAARDRKDFVDLTLDSQNDSLTSFGAYVVGFLS